MKLIFFLEERSMKELLDGILPRILPNGITFKTIPHEGKSDLEHSLPIKLRAWNEPDTSFIVVHDQDSNNCIELKKKLHDLCAGFGKRVLIRIPCHELEAWYWGDLDAVSMAFNKDLRLLKNKRKYKNPDAINNPKLELKRYLPNMGQIDGAKRISQYMDIDKNTSYSFRIFIQGVLAFCNNEA
jgi:hypothetical protein